MSRLTLVLLVLLMLTTLPLTVLRCQLNGQTSQTAVDPCSHPLLYELFTQAERFGVTAVNLSMLNLWLFCLVRSTRSEIPVSSFSLLTCLLHTPPPRI